jgi:hypothetical protein
LQHAFALFGGEEFERRIIAAEYMRLMFVQLIDNVA